MLSALVALACSTDPGAADASPDTGAPAADTDDTADSACEPGSDDTACVDECAAVAGAPRGEGDVHDSCWSCDTAADWQFELWTTPIADVAACEVGVRCTACPE